MEHTAPSPILASNLATKHGFFTRAGGVSEGIYTGLNCGAGSHDSAQHVLENKRRVQQHLDAEALCTLYQIHSADVVMITEASQELNRPKADAMVTTRPYIALGILTADCAPVLLHDAENGVIGAAHAGWKGAVGGVIANTVKAMCDLGATPQTIHAAIGPCIAQESYQVDMLFHNNLLMNNASNAAFFDRDIESSTHYRFNLKGFVEHCLREAGILNIEIMPQNTYTEESDFFSFRRTTHRAEEDYGRQISVIMLAD